MASTMTVLYSAESSGRFWERRALRAHNINAEPELRGRARAGYYEFERTLADAIGGDIGEAGTALTPRLAALAAIIGLRELYETDEARALSSPPKPADLLALVDRVIAFAPPDSRAPPVSRRITEEILLRLPDRDPSGNPSGSRNARIAGATAHSHRPCDCAPLERSGKRRFNPSQSNHDEAGVSAKKPSDLLLTQ